MNIAIGSSALMVTLTATGGLLGHLATGNAAWHEPLLQSVFVFVGSQIGPRLTMRSTARPMRRRFVAHLFALACLVVASSWLTIPAAELADPFVP